MEEGHIPLQLLLLGKLRMGTEAQDKGREESYLPSARSLHLRKQRQAELSKRHCNMPILERLLVV